MTHDHDNDAGLMKEPVIREHVQCEHGWSRLESLMPPYFVVLVRHQRLHRKMRMKQ